MLFRQTRPLAQMSDKEVYIRLYYYYALSKKLNDSELDSGHVQLFLDFAKRLKRRDAATAVMECQVQRLMHADKLHPLTEGEGGAWMFGCQKKKKWNFTEDESCADKFSIYKAFSELPLNLMRCLTVGEKHMLPRLIEHTFFTDQSPSPTLKRLPTPQHVLDAVYALDDCQFLIDSLVLKKKEARILMHLYRFATTKDFDENFHYCTFYSLVMALGISKKDFEYATRPDHGLMENGFIDGDCDLTESGSNCMYAKSLHSLFTALIKKVSTRKTYALDSFSIPREKTDIATSLLRGSEPVNLLLYGAAGSGKTEYAKALIKACGLKAAVFKNSYEAEESSDSAVLGLNLLLSMKNNDTVFIIDEAESLLETRFSLLSLLGDSSSAKKKGSVNKMFENCKNKVIWIVNYTENIDDSTKRRFSYSIHFDPMSERIFRTITETKLKGIAVSSALRERLVDLCGQYEVTGSSIDNMVSVMKSLEKIDDEKVVNDVRDVLEANSSLLYGQARMRERAAPQYDISVLNTSMPAGNIINMVENARDFALKNKTSESGIRMLFYGLSGTGKTELARYIAQRLHKRILLKRASDIFGKYVGETEGKINAAFAEAERTGQILLFDEADSFFRDRALAERSWEISQTNEFLTQMEEFKGILICTTNLRTIMDKAMLRRFHICVEFKALTSDGIRTLLRRYFSAYQFSESQVGRLCRYHSVTPGDFGTLSGRIRFMQGNLINAGYIIDELCRQQEEKEFGSRTIGFGVSE